MSLVEIHRCHDNFEAEQLRELLEQSGIVARLVTKLPQSVFPLVVDGFGEVRIEVLDRDEDEARKIVADFLSLSEYSDTGEMTGDSAGEETRSTKRDGE